MELVATCVWLVTASLVMALDQHLGLPVDSYLNGSQTWLVDVEGSDITLECRLHPVAGYRTPEGCSHYDVWELVVASLSQTPEAPIALGETTRSLDSFWDGLECFVAHGDDVEPATLARLATDAIGLVPDAVGLVDHQRVGDEWERRRGEVSITAMLLEQLSEEPRAR